MTSKNPSSFIGTKKEDEMSLNGSKGNIETRNKAKPSASGGGVGAAPGMVLMAPSARKPPKLKTHNRSLSHNKLNKLTTSAHNRPNLNRSKSTDGLIRSKTSLKGNNRSYTKLSALQPLTKTMSNQSIKSSKSTGSLKGLNPQQNIGLKSSGRKGKAILRFNDDISNDDYEDMDDSTIENPLESEERTNYNPNGPTIYDQLTNIVDNVVPIARALNESRSDSNISNMPTTSENTSQEQVSQSSQPSESIDSRILQKDENFNPQGNTEQSGAQNYSKITSNIKRDIGNGREDDKAAETTIEEDTESTIKQSDLPNIATESRASSNDMNELHNPNGLPNSTRSSTDDFRSSDMYGGSLLLSQSTGLVKKINPKIQYGGVNPVSIPKLESSLDSNSESVSGISFKANKFEQIAEPVTTNKTVMPNNSYQTNQTIFNNLQRTGTQYLPVKPKMNSSNSQLNANTGVNNFSNFLTANQDSSSSQNTSQSMETRTQQRLWLQRENSLMDVANVDSKNFSNLSLNNLMFAHNQSRTNMRDYFSNKPGTGLTPVTPGSQITSLSSTTPKNNSSVNAPSTPGGGNNINGLLMMVQNSAQTSIQSRTEFERTNREYLNVRRHLNPVGKSLNRLEKCQSKDLHVVKGRNKMNASSSLMSNTHNANSNSFKEFSPLYQEKEHEGQGLLQKLWQEAILTSQDMPPSTSQSGVNGTSKPVPNQIYLNQPGTRVNTAQTAVNNLRSPASHTPTTRAVKLAQSGNQMVNSQKKELHI